MSYIVIKSTQSDDGWVHEPVMWTDDEDEAHRYDDAKEILSCVFDGARFNVIETDMTGWLEPCEGKGAYQCGIGGCFYFDEEELEL